MEHESVVVLGDSHIGWEEANVEEFEEFITDEIYRLDPDALVLNGDIVELWRSSFSSVMVNYGYIFNLLTDVSKEGIKIVPIAGNHDWRLIETGRTPVTDTQDVWDYREHYEFESGGEKFIATHGHEADSLNRSRAQNNALCMTSDDTGSLMSTTGDKITNAPALGSVINRRAVFNPQTRAVTARDGPLIQRPSFRAISHVNNPAALAESKNDGRYERIVQILTGLYDRTVLAGHTHRKDNRENYYNPGSWAGSQTGYLYIEDGKVENRSY